MSSDARNSIAQIGLSGQTTSNLLAEPVISPSYRWENPKTRALSIAASRPLPFVILRRCSSMGLRAMVSGSISLLSYGPRSPSSFILKRRYAVFQSVPKIEVLAVDDTDMTFLCFSSPECAGFPQAAILTWGSKTVCGRSSRSSACCSAVRSPEIRLAYVLSPVEISLRKGRLSRSAP